MSSEGPMVPDGIDIMTGELRAPEDVRLAWEPMNRDQAVEATSRVNAYAKRLPMVVKDVFDGRAWEALGYGSWEDYVDDALVWRIAPPDTARLRRMFPIKNDTGAFLHNVADWIDAAARLSSVEVACGLNPGEIVCAPNKLDDSSQWECEGHPGDWWPADRMGMPDRRVICRPRSDRGQG